MSIRTLPNRGGDPLIIFLVLAVIIHMALVWGMSSYGGLSGALLARIMPQKKEPLIVDVVEAPVSGVFAATAPRNPRYYSDKNRSFEKEVYQEGSILSNRVSPRRQSSVAAQAMASQSGVGAQGRRSAVSGAETPTDASKAAVETGNGAEKRDKISKPDSTDMTKTGGDTYTGDKVTGRSAAPTATGAAKNAAVSKSEAAAKAANNRPNLLISNERISELEKKYEAEAPAGERGKTLQLNTSEVRYYKYLMDMKRRIEYFWEYPHIAARNGWEGSLNMDFTIHKDGTVSDVIVIKSSKYPVLDESAVNAIKIAAPFSPFPSDFDKEEITIKASFMYDIYYKPERH